MWRRCGLLSNYFDHLFSLDVAWALRLEPMRSKVPSYWTSWNPCTCIYITALSVGKTSYFNWNTLVSWLAYVNLMQLLKAKFHYATCSKLVRTGRRPVRSQIPLRYLVRSLSPTSFEPVCDQLRTSFEPAIVMEFGFYHYVQQLSYTTQHRAVLIIFPLILQTIVIAQTMSTGAWSRRRSIN